jgi:hypothetical protein
MVADKSILGFFSANLIVASICSYKSLIGCSNSKNCLFGYTGISLVWGVKIIQPFLIKDLFKKLLYPYLCNPEIGN